MLQKMQWSLAAALAAGAMLAAAGQPAQAQVRHHLVRGMTTNYTTGIVIPPSSSTPPPGIVTPPSTPPVTTGIITPPPTGVTSTPAPAPNPAPAPAPAPVTQLGAPSVTPVTTPPVVTNTGSSDDWWETPSPSPASGGQGFSAGPSLIGDVRLPLGRLVDRVPPAIIGDSGPTVQKVIAHR